MKTEVDVKNVGHGAKISWIWPVVLLSWFVLISWLPDPRPLGAPELAVQVVQKVSGASVQVSGLVATVAKREISLAGIAEAKKLRSRITAYGRHDLPRHFWVSAGLAVISDSEASMAVGIAKEMMDSAGGSGFSFIDLTADRAGTLFCIAATRDEDSARAMQRMIRNGALNLSVKSLSVNILLFSLWLIILSF